LIKRVLAFTSSVLFAAATTPLPAHSTMLAKALGNPPGKAKPTGSSTGAIGQPVPMTIEYFRETKRLKEIHYAVSSHSILPLWQDPSEIVLSQKKYFQTRVDQSKPIQKKTIIKNAPNLPQKPTRLSSRGSDSIVPAHITEDTGLKIAGVALSLVGTPYRWGGEGTGGLDCSGLTQYVYRKVGIVIPRTSYEQYGMGIAVPMSGLHPGDLIFFSTSGSGPSHVAVYVGNGLIVQALNESTGVIVSHLSATYYQRHYLGSRRVSV
jgi:cell wall-associated NlpC family hydrolase